MVLDKVLNAVDDFPSLFRQYIANSIQATLADIPHDEALLSADIRDRALHVLSFALKWPDIWPSTCELLLLLAPKLEQAGHRDDWLPYLTAGVKQSQAMGDLGAEAELGLYAGQLERLVSRFAKAREWLTTSEQIFVMLHNHSGQARALNQLAYVAWQQHEYGEAEQLAQSALNLLDETDPERAMSLSALGLVAIDRRQWTQAEQHHQEALRIRAIAYDQRKMAWSMQNLGYALRGQGRYGEAVDYYEQAIRLLDTIQDPVNQAVAQMNLGIAHYYHNQPDKALVLYEQSGLLFRKFQAKIYLAKIFINKALCYLALQDWPQAEYNFLAGANEFQKLDDKVEHLNALDGLGLTYLAQGQFDKSLDIFGKISDALPQISGTPKHEYLSKVLPGQLAQAKQKNRGS